MKTWPLDERTANLKHLMRERRLDAMMVTSWDNLYYLLGVLPIHAAERLTTTIMPLLVPAEDDKEVIFIPTSNFLRAVQEEHWYIKDVRASGLGSAGVFPTVLDIVPQCWEELGVSSRNIGVEFKNLSFFYVEALERRMPKAKFEDCSDLVELQRMIKSKEEKAYCIKACEITDKILEESADLVKPGRTEKEISLEIVARVIEFGADGASFHPQIPSGNRSCLLNITSSYDKAIKSGEVVLLDFGTVYRGYRCDITRPVIIGSPTSKQRKSLEAIKSVTQEALNTVRPGAKASDVHNAAVAKFLEIGYPCVIPDSGHGMGLRAWELPSLSSADQTILRPDMFLAVEQTIFEPSYGIRFEDNLFVTEKGYVDYTKFPMELIEV